MTVSELEARAQEASEWSRLAKNTLDLIADWRAMRDALEISQSLMKQGHQPELCIYRVLEALRLKP